MNAAVQPVARREPLAEPEALGEIATGPLGTAGGAANEPSREAPAPWIERLARHLAANGDETDARHRTRLSCDLRARRPMLLLPPEMGSLQPSNLAWLRGFARRHGFGLVEDRRRAAPPAAAREDDGDDSLARGIALLLAQAGMPGHPPVLSSPHRLEAVNRHLGLDELVRMAAHARPRSKRVVLLPNRLIVGATGRDTHPIVAHACRLSTSRFSTVLSQFDAPAFRCLGYSSGAQYVTHVFLAGGRAAAPELWTRLHLLTCTDFRFRLFPGREPGEDFGLFHATFYHDVANGEEMPWWLSSDARDGMTPSDDALAGAA